MNCCAPATPPSPVGSGELTNTKSIPTLFAVSSMMSLRVARRGMLMWRGKE